MIGTITAAKKSQSLKSVSLTVDGKFFSTTNWEMESMIGQAVEFEPSPQAVAGGKTIWWINDYKPADPRPAAGISRDPQPYSEQHPPPLGQNAGEGTGQPAKWPVQIPPNATTTNIAPQKNMDAVLGAGALIKAFQSDSKENIWDAYTWFYHKLETWSPDDDIPY